MAFFSKASSILRQTASKHINQDIAASKPSMFQLIRCMSSSKVFVGGLSYNTDDTSLSEAFSKYGDVDEARVIQDRETGRSRGFGFVSYASAEAASAAIQALDGQELHGRRIRVNYANDRPRGYAGGGGGYGNTDGYGNSSAYGGGGYDNSGGYRVGGYNNTGGYVGGGYSNTGGYGGGGYGNSDGYANGGNGYGGGNSVGGQSGDAYVAAPPDNFGAGESDNSNMAGIGGGYNHQDPVNGDFWDDDDESGDYANKRA